MRAMQVFQENKEYHDNIRNRFSTHYDCTLAEADKLNFTPWQLGKYQTKCVGGKQVYQIDKQTSFIVEVNSQQKVSNLTLLSDINGISVKVIINDELNVSKGLVCTYNYCVYDFKTFRKGLVE